VNVAIAGHDIGRFRRVILRVAQAESPTLRTAGHRTMAWRQCERPPAMLRSKLMSRLPFVVIALAFGLAQAPAIASQELAKSRNCMACHAADKKLIGPSYRDVAAKYATDKDAVARLARKIREGGVGAWGQIPMPANPQVTADEATALARWVLATR
jgi:cytochrome c